MSAASDHGIAVVHTGDRSDPAIELTWALILTSARHIVTESNSVRSGGWQQTVGTDLRGKTLGVLGLGRIGSQVARVGRAFGMDLIAWSQNLTPETAKAAGAILVSKDELFERADILTIHLVLSNRTRGLVGAAELERMKPTARLINASRGPIVEEQALISVLKNKQIAGAAIDVFDIEPLPPSHAFRTLDNVLATPHIGYVSHGLYKTFYEETGVNKSGLYSEFKDKEDLFLASLERYAQTRGAEILTAQPIGWGNIERFLRLGFGCDDDQRGCFAVNSMRELAGLPAEAQEIISSAQQKLTRLLIKNIEAEDPRLDASMVADVVLTFFHGFCIAQNLKRGKSSSERKIRNLMQVVRNL